MSDDYARALERNSARKRQEFAGETYAEGVRRGDSEMKSRACTDAERAFYREMKTHYPTDLPPVPAPVPLADLFKKQDEAPVRRDFYCPRRPSRFCRYSACTPSRCCLSPKQ